MEGLLIVLLSWWIRHGGWSFPVGGRGGWVRFGAEGAG